MAQHARQGKRTFFFSPFLISHIPFNFSSENMVIDQDCIPFSGDDFLNSHHLLAFKLLNNVWKL